MSSEPNCEAPAKSVSDPVERLTRISLIIIALIFVWYIAADRIAPWTDQARVQAYVVPIVPQVSGRVVEVNVTQNQEVFPGDVLCKIDPSDYELALENAESALEMAGQEIGSSTASVSTAQAELVEAITHLEHMQTQGKRVFELEKKNVLSKADGDKARATIKSAKAQVASARANLEKAKQSLGKEGQENPRIRSAVAALKQAQLNLSRTTIIAPAHGGITNLQLDIGHYANSGQPLMTFIEVDNVWIEANLRENSIANIKPGNTVDIALDAAPGRIFKGKVSSVGFAVENANSGEIGSLATVKGESGWLRDAQRFPVVIEFTDDEVRGYRRLGGQVDVQIYTSNNWLINPLGWLWIRLLSWVSYIY